MSEKFECRSSVTVKEATDSKDFNVGTGIVIICILGIMCLAWYAWYSSTHEDQHLTPKETELITEIFEYDYIVIDGIEYATKDICEIDPDWPYMAMAVNDQQTVVRFNAHEFTLHN